MDGKTILLIMSVVAVGMFVLPSSLALYTGQHDFVGRDDVDCAKCHAASQDRIAKELYNGTVHNSLSCKDCHYGDAGTVGGRFAVDVIGNWSEKDVTAHAAGVTVNCIDCHSYPDAYQPPTKDIGATGGSVNVSYELSLSGEAHKYLSVNLSATNGGVRDRDAACIGCHTRLTSYNFNGTDLDLGQASDTGTLYLTKNETESWMYDDRQ